MRKKLYIDYTKVCRTNTTHHLCLIPAEKGKALDRYSPSLFWRSNKECTKYQKNRYHRTHCFFSSFSFCCPCPLLPESTISYSRNPGWETPEESERISNGREKSDNSPPATPNGDGKEEEPCDLIRVLPHTISKREAVGCCTVLQATGFLLLKTVFDRFRVMAFWEPLIRVYAVKNREGESEEGRGRGYV